MSIEPLRLYKKLADLGVREVHAKVLRGEYPADALPYVHIWLNLNEKPHWTQVPSFWLLVVSVLLAAAALAVAFVGPPQAQSPVSVAVPSTQIVPPALGMPASSAPQLPSSTASQVHKPQK